MTNKRTPIEKIRRHVTSCIATIVLTQQFDQEHMTTDLKFAISKAKSALFNVLVVMDRNAEKSKNVHGIR